MTSILYAKRRWLALIATLCFGLLNVGCSRAQDATPQARSTQNEIRPLSDADIKALYQNCPGGWYSGPRPGKTRFARDPWLWVVTPEFAKRFCMPPDFVSSELKGAEAVAFRLLRKVDDENCGYGGNANACFGETVLRFDVYIKSDVKLPRLREGRYFQVPPLLSKMLISPTEEEINFYGRQKRDSPERSLEMIFEPQQIGLEGVKDGVIAWPIVTLYHQTHFGGAFEGIDYYAFEGSTGFFENPGIKQHNVTRFNLTFQMLGYRPPKSRRGMALSELAHLVELPQGFTDRIAEADRTRGRNVGAMLNEAFRPGGPQQGVRSK